MLRILIVDAHPVYRKGVQNLIAGHSGWEVCGEAADGVEALPAALDTSPDMAIVDAHLPIMSGITLTGRLRELCPKTRVLILTQQDDDETVRSALEAGARGYILKNDSEITLRDAISAVGANRPYFSSVVSEMLLNAATGRGPRSRLRSFTPREIEVGQLMAEGQTNRDIALAIGVSVKTVESHRSAAMRKADVNSASQFVRFAIKHSLIEA